MFLRTGNLSARTHRAVVLTMLGACLVTWGWAETSQGAEAPLAVFPQDTGVIVRMAAPKKTIANVAQAVDKVQPGFGGMVEGQASSIGVGISNPTLQGVDMESDWWMGVFLSEDKQPQVAFVIPATDIGDMEDAIDESFAFHKEGNWGIYSEDESAVERIKATIAGTTPNIVRAFSGKLLSGYQTGDLSIYVNTPTLASVYQDEIEQAKAEGLQKISEMDELPPGMGMDLESIKNMLPKLIDHLYQTVLDNEGMVLTLNAGMDGVQLNKIVSQKPSSESAKFLQNFTSGSTNSLLQKMPAGEPIYMTSSMDIMKLSTKFNELYFSMMKSNADAQSAIAEMNKILSKAKYEGFAASIGLGTLEGGVLRLSAYNAMTPPEIIKELQPLVPKLMKAIDNPDIEQTIGYQEAAETFQGKPVDIITIKQDYIGGDPSVRQTMEMTQSIMYGSEGMVTRVYYLENGYVQSMGGGQEQLEKTINAYNVADNLSSGSALARDIKAMPEKTSFMQMIDLVTLVADGLSIAAATGQVPILLSPEQIDGIEVTPSYVGMTVGVEDNVIEARLNIPLEQIQSGVLFGTQIMMMMQNPN